jgi:ATP-dependent RNA helicase DeaD
MPTAIRRIIQKYMDNPLEEKSNTQEVTNKDISHQYVVLKASDKLTALRRFLDIHPEMRGVLFCRTKRDTEQIAEQLGRLGYTVAALNGDMSQDQREKVMKRFKTHAMQLLIATDVAARGIDVKELSHVIHHSLPDQSEYYTHRSGRTGRAGSKGISLAFITSRDQSKIRLLEKENQVTFEKVQIPTHEEVLASRMQHWADLIKNTKIHDKAESLLQAMQGQFADLSKEDLLKRLISTQLDHLMLDDDSLQDLNQTDRKRSDRKTSEPSNNRSFSSKENTSRYFVNLGKIDGITSADLVHFLSDVSGVDRKHFSGVSLQKNCAYFDIDDDQHRGLSQKFKGIQVEGRDIRVNPDDQSHKSRAGNRSSNKPKSERGFKKSGSKGRPSKSGRKRFKR